MDFMAGYGSDEDEEQEVTLPTYAVTSSAQSMPPPPSVKGTPAVKAVNGGKKKKKLDISFLPQHIQDALLNGGQEDSDDNHNTYAPKPTNFVQQQSRSDERESGSEEAKPTKPVANGSADPLLQMLSAPKTSSKAKDPFQTSISATSTYNFQAKSPSKQEDEAEDEDIPRVKPTASFHNNSAPVVYSNLSSAAKTTTSIDWSKVSAPTASYQPSSSSGNAYSSSGYTEDITSTTLKRKRERDIESQLLSGNLSSLESIPVQEIGGFNSWDKGSYIEQQEREQEILNMYTGNGPKSLAQPNKVQNRKHQLSSLAMKAAETEIAMLESKGQKSKSKAQTMNRYGW